MIKIISLIMVLFLVNLTWTVEIGGSKGKRRISLPKIKPLPKKGVKKPVKGKEKGGKDEGEEEEKKQKKEYDVVYLFNGHSIKGELETIPSDKDKLVTIIVGKSKISIERSKIKKLKLSISKRMSSLDKQSNKELLELVHYVLMSNQNQKAYELLQSAAKGRKLSLPLLLLLAQLTESFDGTQKAFPIYKKYRAGGGKDTDALFRLREIEANENEHQANLLAEKRRLKNKKPVRNGLEEKKWKAEGLAYSNPIKILLSDVEKNKTLQLSFEGGAHYKAIALLREPVDGIVKNSFSFYVYNPELKGLKMSIAVKTGNNFTYHESKPFTLEKSDEWEEVYFDLDASDFKTEKSGWAHRSRIINKGTIKEIQLQFHNKNRDGVVLIDAVNFLSRVDDIKGL